METRVAVAMGLRSPAYEYALEWDGVQGLRWGLVVGKLAGCRSYPILRPT